MDFRIPDLDVLSLIGQAAKVAGLDVVVYSDYERSTANVMFRTTDAALAATSPDYKALADSLRVYRSVSDNGDVTYIYSLDIGFDSARLDWRDIQTAFDRVAHDLRTSPYPPAVRKTFKRFADNARNACETELDTLLFA